jgi:hypothetical protein
MKLIRELWEQIFRYIIGVGRVEPEGGDGNHVIACQQLNSSSQNISFKLKRKRGREVRGTIEKRGGLRKGER